MSSLKELVSNIKGTHTVYISIFYNLIRLLSLDFVFIMKSEGLHVLHLRIML